jgi:hypothetical protein
MNELEMPDVPSSLSLLVDPTLAVRAAQRLYAARGQGLCHSGWLGATVALGQTALLHDDEDDDDNDD